jgi:hypothetical protein
MKLQYIIPVKKGEDLNGETVQSIQKNCPSGVDDFLPLVLDELTLEEGVNDVMNKAYERYKEQGVTHIVIVPNKSTITQNFHSIAEQYTNQENTIYLPVVQYFELSEDGKESKFRGLLNTCMWKPYGNNEYGLINEDLAVKQIDTTLYGAIIPLDTLKTYPLKTKIKFYSFFEYISRMVHKGVVVQGIPKVTVLYTADDTLKKATQEEKVKYFTACQSEYKNDTDVELVTLPTQAESAPAAN